jgi:hypothetical protein
MDRYDSSKSKKVMAKKIGTICVIDDFHFENDIGQYIDVHVSLEGYITLDLETSTQYSIESQAELDLIYQKLTEALKTAKRKAK